ncbi:MAG: hypothetical protein ACI3ZG_04925 [Candidatus Coprenecus sp.]
MLKFCFIIITSLIAYSANAQNYNNSNTRLTISSPDNNVNFRLFQTNNAWTFLRLDTRNGIISHVQYSTDSNQMIYPLNEEPLVQGDDALPGRFFLYPTENSYNFILLDQIDGRVWQVQWNQDESKRGIWQIK